MGYEEEGWQKKQAEVLLFYDRDYLFGFSRCFGVF
jgi:hypothetical protein